MRGIGVAVMPSTVNTTFRLTGERKALLHTKPVLFINDSEAKVFELHIVLDDGVCANQQINLTRRQAFKQCLTGFAFIASR